MLMETGIPNIKTLSAELASSTDNKTSVYALMDKINFDRQRYRLGKKRKVYQTVACCNLRTHHCLLPGRRTGWT